MTKRQALKVVARSCLDAYGQQPTPGFRYKRTTFDRAFDIWFRWLRAMG